MTDLNKIVSDKKAILQSADVAWRTLEAEYERAKEEALRRVAAEFNDRRSVASTALFNANKEYEEALVAAANGDSRVGLKVFRTEQKPLARWSSKTEEVTIYGIIEVMAPGVELPANLNYGRPRNGDLFVRVLKNDGTTGKKIERLGPAWSPAV